MAELLVVSLKALLVVLLGFGGSVYLFAAWLEALDIEALTHGRFLRLLGIGLAMWLVAITLAERFVW